MASLSRSNPCPLISPYDEQGKIAFRFSIVDLVIFYFRNQKVFVFEFLATSSLHIRYFRHHSRSPEISTWSFFLLKHCVITLEPSTWDNQVVTVIKAMDIKKKSIRLQVPITMISIGVSFLFYRDDGRVVGCTSYIGNSYIRVLHFYIRVLGDLYVCEIWNIERARKYQYNFKEIDNNTWSRLDNEFIIIFATSGSSEYGFM